MKIKKEDPRSSNEGLKRKAREINARILKEEERLMKAFNVEGRALRKSKTIKIPEKVRKNTGIKSIETYK